MRFEDEIPKCRSQLRLWRVVPVKTLGRKIDSMGNWITESTQHFFVIILNWIFTHLTEIKIFEKLFIVLEKNF